MKQINIQMDESKMSKNQKKAIFDKLKDLAIQNSWFIKINPELWKDKKYKYVDNVDDYYIKNGKIYHKNEKA